MASNRGYISKAEAHRIAAKHGGSPKLMRITDQDGHVLRDDGDMLKTIKFSVSNGQYMKKGLTEQEAKDDARLQELKEDYICPHCNRVFRISVKSLYMGYYRVDKSDPAYDPEIDARDWWYCEGCSGENFVLDLPESKEEQEKIFARIKEIEEISSRSKMAKGLVRESTYFFKKDK